VKFILCTTEPHKVPATIQSRCQRFDFKPIATGRIVEHLKNVLAQEGLQADDAAVHLVARLGNGSMRDALSLLDRLIAAASGTLTARLAEETLGLPDAALIAAVTAAAVAGDAKAGLQAGARLLESGCPVEQSLELLAARLRDLLVLRACGADTDLVELAPEAKAQAAAEAEHFDSEELVHLVAVCEAALRAARSTSSPRTVFDATLARLCLHRGFEPIDASSGSADEKKKVSEAPAAMRPVRAEAPAVVARPVPSAPEPARVAATPVRAAPAPVAAPAPTARPASTQSPATQTSTTQPADVAEAWSRITAIAVVARDAAMVEALEPVAISGQTLRLRVASEAGMSGAFAARRIEPLQDLVRKALGPAWKVAVDAPREAPVVGAAPAHGLEQGIAENPLVREALDAFDAIIMKVERRAPSRVPESSPEAPDAEGAA
jgi:DNA polymerase-3 subunit gamma/tau